MPNMKYKYIHDCNLPSMVVKEEEWTTGRFFWKQTHKRKLFDKRHISWECTCKAQWKWAPNYRGEKGFWMCSFRPNVWKKMSEK